MAESAQVVDAQEVEVKKEEEEKVARSLMDLPLELLHKIKGHMHDLQTHVHFSQICKTTNALYNDTMWQKMLFAAGFSIPMLFSRKEEGLWGGMALAIVNDAETLGDYKIIQSWIKSEVIFEDTLSLDSRSDIKTATDVKKEKKQIDTRNEVYIDCNIGEAMDEMFVFHDPDDEDYDYDKRPKVFEHPSVAGRLFTSPALSKAMVNDGKSDAVLPISNPFGLTNMDALMAIGFSLSCIPPEYWEETDHRWYEGFYHQGGSRFSVNWGS